MHFVKNIFSISLHYCKRHEIARSLSRSTSTRMPFSHKRLWWWSQRYEI